MAKKTKAKESVAREIFLRIDLKLLDRQIRAMLYSNMEEPEKTGLHNLLGEIYDRFEE
jgi:hypothetical protein